MMHPPALPQPPEGSGPIRPGCLLLIVAAVVAVAAFAGTWLAGAL